MILQFDTNKAKDKVVNKLYDFSRWCKEHKEALLVIVPVACTITSKTFRYAARKSNIRAEKNLKDLYIYDRSLGIYLRLRKKLTSSQVIQIDKRRKAGESLASILASMRVLK